VPIETGLQIFGQSIGRTVFFWRRNRPGEYGGINYDNYNPGNLPPPGSAPSAPLPEAPAGPVPANNAGNNIGRDNLDIIDLNSVADSDRGSISSCSSTTDPTSDVTASPPDTADTSDVATSSRSASKLFLSKFNIFRRKRSGPASVASSMPGRLDIVHEESAEASPIYIPNRRGSVQSATLMLPS